ncbi:hypothetical protein [Bradyrhizobium sp. BR13661]|jgi:hypothetical protein|uniref:hypothetical protein n=1 Tax=Bradyrhizobium sp. BR13661 TaxID=2940622 RepID=UPI0024751C30|nr:hypothetical protein [Bradyrhizobium sp. BR13661]MDH6262623.1 hypothetical protein [Bradyrhizobium sp. BR13661]
MIRLERTFRAVLAALVAVSVSTVAEAQGFSRSHGNAGPPVENRPKVDEKAYKAALDRIPVSTEKYDPWGGARTNDATKPPKKSN